MEESEEIVYVGPDEVYNPEGQKTKQSRIARRGKTNFRRTPVRIIRNNFKKKNNKTNNKDYYYIIQKWNEFELKKLKQLYRKYPDQWNTIATLFQTRNKTEIIAKYRQLKKRKGWQTLIKQRRKKGWTPQQNENLFLKLKQYDYDWKRIEKEFGRSQQVCKHHYKYLKEKKKIWKEQQLQKLMSVGPTLQQDWEKSYKYFSDRTSLECRDKYQQLLEAIQTRKAAKQEQRKRKMENQKARLQKKQKKQKKQVLQKKIPEDEQKMKWEMVKAIQKYLSHPTEEISKTRIRKWLPQQDNFLIYLQKKYKQQWIHVSQHMVNRSNFQCEIRYKQLEQRQIDALEKSRKSMIVPTFTAYLKQNQNKKESEPSWTQDEQIRFSRFADQNPEDVNYIMKFFPDRSKSQIKKKIISRQTELKYCKPAGLSSQDEQLLQLLIVNHKGNLQIILKSFPDHNYKDIYKKYLEILKTSENPIIKQIQVPKIKNIDSYVKQKKESLKVDNSCKKEREWSKQEDMNLLEFCKKYRNSWKYISKKMLGRTLQQLKSRYLYLKNKVPILENSVKSKGLDQISANIVQEIQQMEQKIQYRPHTTMIQNQPIEDFTPIEIIDQASLLKTNNKINQQIQDESQDIQKNEQVSQPQISVPQSEQISEKQINSQNEEEKQQQQHNTKIPQSLIIARQEEVDKIFQQELSKVKKIKELPKIKESPKVKRLKKIHKKKKVMIKIKSECYVLRSETDNEKCNHNFNLQTPLTILPKKVDNEDYHYLKSEVQKLSQFVSKLCRS